MKLAPWLQSQLQSLLAQRGHAWLLCGPSGLGQWELALALARAWLCSEAGEQGACGQCASCHAFEVHIHADLCVLIPEALSLALGWPLDEKTQDELDSKKRKPSQEIKIEAARQAIAFTQRTRSGGTTKVVLVYPAERMNTATANALLKTLEEPPGAVKFVLATESAHQLLPTIRSRCQAHTLRWPDFEQALAWLQGQGDAAPEAQLRTLLMAVGGRPSDVLGQLQGALAAPSAQKWQALPGSVARGDVAALSDGSPAQAIDALQKICHDVWAVKVGAQPRFFSAADLPPAPSLWALASWAKELALARRTAEHPYNAGLMFEALACRAQMALRGNT